MSVCIPYFILRLSYSLTLHNLLSPGEASQFRMLELAHVNEYGVSLAFTQACTNVSSRLSPYDRRTTPHLSMCDRVLRYTNKFVSCVFAMPEANRQCNSCEKSCQDHEGALFAQCREPEMKACQKKGHKSIVWSISCILIAKCLSILQFMQGTKRFHRAQITIIGILEPLRAQRTPLEFISLSFQVELSYTVLLSSRARRDV